MALARILVDERSVQHKRPGLAAERGRHSATGRNALIRDIENALAEVGEQIKHRNRHEWHRFQRTRQ